MRICVATQNCRIGPNQKLRFRCPSSRSAMRRSVYEFLYKRLWVRPNLSWIQVILGNAARLV